MPQSALQALRVRLNPMSDLLYVFSRAPVISVSDRLDSNVLPTQVASEAASIAVSACCKLCHRPRR